MKKHVWLIALLLTLNASLLSAADSTPTTTDQTQTDNVLQQQLQKIESSLQAEATPKPSVAQRGATATTPASPSFTHPRPSTSAAVSITPSATPSPQEEVPDNALREEAFSKMANTMLPLSPSQIEMLRSLYDTTQKAAAAFPGTPPKPTSTSIMVDLSPGKTPPVIRLGAGFVTSLVFVDSTGAPWPISSYSLGNPTAFNIQWDKVSNILLMQAITSHRVANLAVLLKGLNTPVMINLTPGQAAMDTRVDLRIPGFGPSAKPPTFSAGLPGVESNVLIALLDGIPPEGAKALKTGGCENCAWLFNEKLYLRMQYTLLSPGWISTLSSADGTHVYELQPTPLVLASYHGKTIHLSIEGF